MLHIPSMKGLTRDRAVKPLPVPEVCYVSLSQHIGCPATPMVKVGDRVLMYQPVGRAAEGLSAMVHAPVSGTVEAIGPATLAGGRKAEAVTIRNDGRDEAFPLKPLDLAHLTPQRLIAAIKAAGIVGMGGAQFPVAAKYEVGDRCVDTLIINGMECEPYLTADYALMASRAEAIVRAMVLVGSQLHVKRAVLAIERQNRDLVKTFAPYIEEVRGVNVSIKVLPDGYPQGSELQLIRYVTGIEVPKSALPRDYGVVVTNVATLHAIWEAVTTGRPLVKRILTVSGPGAGEAMGNYEVRIGTPVSHIVSSLDIDATDCNVILGGPMMGQFVTGPSAPAAPGDTAAATPLTKGSSGLLFLPAREANATHCIRCGYCAEVCPMHLQPMRFAELARRGHPQQMAAERIDACLVCAACEYVCPARVPLISAIREGKAHMTQAKR